MRRYFLTKLLSFFIFLFPFALFAQQSLNVAVKAKAALLINSETGNVLFEKAADQPLFPASTTKIITALYVLDRKSALIDQRVKASHDALLCVSPSARRSWKEGRHPPYRLEHGGTHIRLQPGEEMTIRALLYGLLLSSGNDAANVIAEGVSGSVGRFMEELNAYVKELGCTQTHLYTPHGLPHPEHLTTARDLTLLARRAMQIPLFREIVKTVKAVRPETNLRQEESFEQFNALLKPGPFYYPRAVGVKTGYTSASGYTLVAAAEDPSRPLVAVILGCEAVEERYRDAIALFEAAYQEVKSSRTLFSRGFDHFTKRVEGAANALEASLGEDLVFSFFPSEEPKIFSSIEWSPISRLPLEVGACVGAVRISGEDGKVLLSAPLFAKQRLLPTLSYRLRQGFVDYKGEILALLGASLLLLTLWISRRALPSQRGRSTP